MLPKNSHTLRLALRVLWSRHPRPVTAGQAAFFARQMGLLPRDADEGRWSVRLQATLVRYRHLFDPAGNRRGYGLSPQGYEEARLLPPPPQMPAAQQGNRPRPAAPDAVDRELALARPGNRSVVEGLLAAPRHRPTPTHEIRLSAGAVERAQRDLVDLFERRQAGSVAAVAAAQRHLEAAHDHLLAYAALQECKADTTGERR